MSQYIPIEIVIQILKRLPVESLLRFRSVCRWMNQIVDSPIFIQDHLALLSHPRFIAIYQGRDLLVVNPHTPSIAAAPLIRSSDSEHVNLVGTLHGIVCFYYYNSHFMLCNLSIGKSLTIPLPDLDKPPFTDAINYDDVVDVDQNKLEDEIKDGSCVFYGFWIDPNTQQFKIVIFKLLDPDIMYINDVILYSSITQDWEPLLPYRVWLYPSLSERPAVVIGKVAYWRLIGYIKDDGDIGNGASIVSFDFEHEGLDMIKAPIPDYTLQYPPVLSRWQDTLSLVFVDEENHCEVYFREAEDSWLKKLTFNLTTLTNLSRIFSMVESEGQDSDLAEDSLDNTRILAATCSDELVLCNNGPAYIALVTELLDEFTLCVAYDYVGSLLFPRR